MTHRTSTNTLDATDYYRKYNTKEDKHESHSIIGVLVGECYLNFSKLLQSEMRQFDKRDSSILQKKMSIHVKKNLSSRTKVESRHSSRFEFSTNLSDKRKRAGAPVQSTIEKKPFEE